MNFLSYSTAGDPIVNIDSGVSDQHNYSRREDEALWGRRCCLLVCHAGTTLQRKYSQKTGQRGVHVSILPSDPSLREKLASIRLLVTDVDGVMTDGRAYYDDEGMALRAFSMRDGFGFVLAKFAGIEIGVLTGNLSGTIHARMKKFNISRIKGGHFRKSSFFNEMIEELGLSAEHAAYIGDDLFDIPVMQLAGLSFAPADGHPDVCAHADAVTEARGGYGVVREVVEALVKAQGRWDDVLREIEEDTGGGLGS
jgi:3-deoxy-D-manno-octulosonate 8-phosphate phosphatase (KDO 8-P phosphatase)